jgi:hypothetical protein
LTPETHAVRFQDRPEVKEPSTRPYPATSSRENSVTDSMGKPVVNTTLARASLTEFLNVRGENGALFTDEKKISSYKFRLPESIS